MFSINHQLKNLSQVELSNSSRSSLLKLSLEEGGRISFLRLKDETLIKDPENTTYKGSFAASILFPFANRIPNGAYTFNNKNYRLPLNFEGEDTAIHGLVYNAPFKIDSKTTTTEYAQVSIRYEALNPPSGFPFPYVIILTYTLYEHYSTLTVRVENVGTTAFPFGLGWHPYFYTQDKSKSTIRFKSNEDLASRKYHTLDCTTFLDDCFQTKDPIITFNTPTYKINLHTDSSTYLQVYTPPADPHGVAIEPMTSPANSFNTLEGILYLDPSEAYETTWTVSLTH